jgi:hypothetical protein
MSDVVYSVFDEGWDESKTPNEIVDGLFLGSRNDAQNLEKLNKLNIQIVLNMAEFEDNSGLSFLFISNKKGPNFILTTTLFKSTKG